MQDNSRSQEVADTVKATVKDAFNGFKVFVVNPVGGLPSFFSGLGKDRALGVGIVFAVVYIICILFSASKSSELLGVDLGIFRSTILSIIPFVSFVGASSLTRKIFRGVGSFQGDVFIAGASLLPPGLLILLGSVLGIANIEVVTILAIVAITYTILMAYTGCNQISKIPETASALAVSCIELLQEWR